MQGFLKLDEMWVPLVLELLYTAILRKFVGKKHTSAHNKTEM